jgi:hypothetical protein
MSEDKIIISFDDEKPAHKDEKIIIDVGEPEKIITENRKTIPEINLNNLKLNSFFKDNCSLCSFSTSQMTFPSGVENGFGDNFSIDLKDVFLNSLLENNLYIIASSKSGNIYFIDRKNGMLSDKKFIDKESFEKTGFVYHNEIFINSLNSIYKIVLADKSSNLSLQKIYDAADNFIIWSNLNYYAGKIIFVEFSRDLKTACLRIIDYDNYELIYEFKFKVEKYVSDSVTIGKNNLLLLFDNKILIVDLLNQNTKFLNLNFNCSEESFVLFLNNKFYFNNSSNDLLYIEMDVYSGKVNFSGISSSIINSIAGFEDNIFIGNSNGWDVYKANGTLLFSFDDTTDNKIESLNKNILAVSKQNRIVFHNLNRFQEAEGFTLSTGPYIYKNDIVASVKISFDGIFVLTKNGLLRVFNNDKLNLNI